MLIIEDRTMGQSWSFVATSEGYAEAYRKILEIEGQGHMLGGDVSKVTAYFGV
ncbi:MAG: hypothetical protein Q4B29_03115 [Candidatus Saccharibacteria bacterium]|nr:hypothetical protein [Candidatus Saccharibacteria bacterium]